MRSPTLHHEDDAFVYVSGSQGQGTPGSLVTVNTACLIYLTSRNEREIEMHSLQIKNITESVPFNIAFEINNLPFSSSIKTNHDRIKLSIFLSYLYIFNSSIGQAIAYVRNTYSSI